MVRSWTKAPAMGTRAHCIDRETVAPAVPMLWQSHTIRTKCESGRNGRG